MVYLNFIVFFFAWSPTCYLEITCLYFSKKLEFFLICDFQVRALMESCTYNFAKAGQFYKISSRKLKFKEVSSKISIGIFEEQRLINFWVWPPCYFGAKNRIKRHIFHSCIVLWSFKFFIRRPLCIFHLLPTVQNQKNRYFGANVTEFSDPGRSDPLGHLWQ